VTQELTASYKEPFRRVLPRRRPDVRETRGIVSGHYAACVPLATPSAKTQKLRLRIQGYLPDEKGALLDGGKGSAETLTGLTKKTANSYPGDFGEKDETAA
jgi:hypothetical protein